jgi:hypothetical protein
MTPRRQFVCVCGPLSFESNWCRLFSQASSVGAPNLPVAQRTVFKHNSGTDRTGRANQESVPSPTGGVFQQLDRMVLELPVGYVNVYKTELSASFKGRKMTR